MSRLHTIDAPELRTTPASLFDNASDFNQDDYFDQLQEEAETELLRMGVGARRALISEDSAW